MAVKVVSELVFCRESFLCDTVIVDELSLLTIVYDDLVLNTFKIMKIYIHMGQVFYSLFSIH